MNRDQILRECEHTIARTLPTSCALLVHCLRPQTDVAHQKMLEPTCACRSEIESRTRQKVDLLDQMNESKLRPVGEDLFPQEATSVRGSIDTLMLKRNSLFMYGFQVLVYKLSSFRTSASSAMCTTTFPWACRLSNRRKACRTPVVVRGYIPSITVFMLPLSAKDRV